MEDWCRSCRALTFGSRKSLWRRESDEHSPASAVLLVRWVRDTVSENDNQDTAFVEQWWAVLRPWLPAPQAMTAAEVIALVKASTSLEKSRTSWRMWAKLLLGQARRHGTKLRNYGHMSMEVGCLKQVCGFGSPGW